MSLGESWQALSGCIAPDAQIFPAANARNDEWYALFVDQPRSMLLPAHHRAARNTALKFFAPELVRVIQGHARLLFNDLFGAHATLPLMTLPPAFTMELCRQLAITESPQLAFQIGPPGPYQKASILVMESEGAPLALVKVALGAQASTMIGAETAWLRTLNCCPTLDGAVPGLLRAGSARTGCRYVVESLLLGGRGTRTFSRLHVQFLETLGAVDCYTDSFSRSPLHRSLHRDLAKMESALSPDQRSLLTDVLEDCSRTLGTWQGPLVISHGDFTPENIRVRSASIFVFDWEYAAAGMSPLFDLLHFHLAELAASGRGLDARTLSNALNQARNYAQVAYPGFNWSPPVVVAHTLAYLLHTLLFNGLSQGQLREEHPLIREYLTLLRSRDGWIP